jgi:hypothetical protein
MANSTVDTYGITRATAETYNLGQGAEIQMNYNNRGDQLVALGLPQRAELARLGQMWTCRMATGSAFTYVAAWPTTRGELVLYNGEASGGKSLVIEKAWMYGITSMAAAQPITLIGQLVPVVGTVPTNDTAQLITSHNGKTSSYAGRARVAVANTAAGQTTNLWDVLASTNAPMTTNLGLAVIADLWGQYIIPPGGVFALAGIAGTAAGTATIGVTWAEVQLALG